MTCPIRLFSISLLIVLSTPAQRLYNEGQDRRAQEAMAASAVLRDSSVFERALANLAEVQRLQQENVLLGARRQTEDDVNSWSDWASVRSTVERVRDDLRSSKDASEEDWKKALARIADAQKELNDSLKALKAKIAASNPQGDINAIGDWMERIGRLKPVADYLMKLAENGKPSQADVDAAAQASAALSSIATLYKSFTIQIPDRPSTIFLGFRLQLLEADEQHYKSLMAIRQRRDAETAGIATLAGKVLLAIERLRLQGSVADSLRDQAARAKPTTGDPKLAERNQLDVMLTALLNAATVAARGHVPSDLARQRESLEHRAHTLRRSRMAASVYEELLANGAQRLAAYYHGGIRPQNLAQLLQALTTAGVIPAILTSK